MTTKLDTLHSQLAGALRRAQKLHTEALPKFNWGASALDAHAIQLLNEVPGDVAAALAQYDAAAAQQAAHTFHVEPTPVLAVMDALVESTARVAEGGTVTADAHTVEVAKRTRAAVAELIEADVEFDAARLSGNAARIGEAATRRRAALARVKGVSRG